MSLIVEILLCSIFTIKEKYFDKPEIIYFDTQDFYHGQLGPNNIASSLPIASKSGTFLPLLKMYISVSKILITVAAASITFAGIQSERPGIYQAKLFLAFSIVYGVTFCALALYFYDEYGYNIRFYTAFRYGLVESLGFSFLTCFLLGFGWWALSLAPSMVRPGWGCLFPALFSQL
jgi:hypothetical protein